MRPALARLSPANHTCEIREEKNPKGAHNEKSLFPPSPTTSKRIFFFLLLYARNAHTHPHLFRQNKNPKTSSRNKRRRHPRTLFPPHQRERKILLAKAHNPLPWQTSHFHKSASYFFYILPNPNILHGGNILIPRATSMRKQKKKTVLWGVG